MARGITESDVHTAADEIVGAGERPTVERIRAHLGTGSPNTVTRWLETWWQGLGQRLHAQQVRLAVPAAPDAVAALAAEWWALALECARVSADEDLAADRAALQDERDGLHRDREAFGSEAAVLREQAETAAHAERVASTQAAELQRLVSRLEGQIGEVSQQREAALARAVEAEAVRQAVEQRLQEHQEAAQAERESLANHVRTVEDRAHAEVDRARNSWRPSKRRMRKPRSRWASGLRQPLRKRWRRSVKPASSVRGRMLWTTNWASSVIYPLHWKRLCAGMRGRQRRRLRGANDRFEGPASLPRSPMSPQSGDLREVARHVGASEYAARHRRALDHARNVPQDCCGDAYKSAVPNRYTCDFPKLYRKTVTWPERVAKVIALPSPVANDVPATGAAAPKSILHFA